MLNQIESRALATLLYALQIVLHTLPNWAVCRHSDILKVQVHGADLGMEGENEKPQESINSSLNKELRWLHGHPGTMGREC